MTSAEELSASLDGNEAIPFPRIDLDRVLNPVPAILASEEFLAADRYFIASAVNQRALVPSRTHALMHALVRNQRPAQIVEIGTYHGGTTEMLARAVTANGGGTVHTVGPFDQEAFLPVYDRWPAQLRETVRFYPTDSMAFFMEMDRQEIQPDLVFVDSDHTYEFVLFDLQCAARRLSPGGFLIADDSIQAGPFFAVQDFLAAHSDWINCTGPDPQPHDRTLAFDRSRMPIPDTSLIVLRAPAAYQLMDGRPRTFGEKVCEIPEVYGVNLAFDGRQEPGVLHVQCVLGGFGNELPPEQIMATGSAAIEPGQRAVDIRLSPPAVMQRVRDRLTLETWVIWLGPGSLCLETRATPF